MKEIYRLVELRLIIDNIEYPTIYKKYDRIGVWKNNNPVAVWHNNFNKIKIYNYE